MIECAELTEIKSIIAEYLYIDAEILGLEYLLESVRYEFYASRSLTGTAPLGHSADDYQHTISPYWATVAIIESEDGIKKQIAAKNQRRELLLQFIDRDDLDRLRETQKKPYLSGLELEVYEYIKEIEFYLEQHKLSQRRATIEPEAVQQQHEIVTQEISIMNRIRGLKSGLESRTG